MRIRWFSFIRVVGVTFVLLYHFFRTTFTGGFIGVDLFFVFSGYLITSLLIDEYGRNKKIALIDFYRRRFYRIVPPVVLMLLVTLPLTLLVRRDFIANLSHQVLAVLGFVTNIYEISIGGNYESQFTPHLFVHMWSLAIEMQFYILWGFLAFLAGKLSRNIKVFKASLFLLSLIMFLGTFISMFVRAFTTANYSTIYYSSFTHSFPFFLGCLLAIFVGIQIRSQRYQKLSREIPFNRVLMLIGFSLLVLILLLFTLNFDSIITYTIGFLLATLAGVVLVFGTRLLHDKTPQTQEPFLMTFIASTSYGVYLFHWPLYIIFGQTFSNGIAALLTTVLSFALAGLSFYILEPLIAGKQPQLMGVAIEFGAIKKPLLIIGGVLASLSVLVIALSFTVKGFDNNMTANALQQSANSIQATRTTVDNKKATGFNTTTGVTVIGDSVTLRASQWITSDVKDVQIDAKVDRTLAQTKTILKKDIKTGSLLQDVVIATGVNTVNDYQAELDDIVNLLPKGHRLILVTPYDGRSDGDTNSIPNKQRQYELSLAKKHGYITIADWHQVAIANPTIWVNTDKVHFGVSGEPSLTKGGKLYAKTIKDAVEKADKGSVKNNN